MRVAHSPCSSCPYRIDTPAGIWDRAEYEKLRQYDDNQAFGLFLCHQSPFIGEDTACRGWLSVHNDSVAVRLAMMRGTVTPEQVYAEVSEPLYETGNQAAESGLKRPGKKARMAIRILQERKHDPQRAR